jgi:hypothetical protein
MAAAIDSFLSPTGLRPWLKPSMPRWALPPPGNTSRADDADVGGDREPVDDNPVPLGRPSMRTGIDDSFPPLFDRHFLAGEIQVVDY